MTIPLEMLRYSRSFLGVPYVWGGNNRLTGMDCSGFVCEVLRSAGIIGPEDYTAHDLFDKLAAHPNIKRVTRVYPASILFFKEKDAKYISHVAFAIDSRRMIEAGGGGGNCKDFSTAARFGAMVRERPVTARNDLFVVLHPDYLALEGRPI